MLSTSLLLIHYTFFPWCEIEVYIHIPRQPIRAHVWNAEFDLKRTIFYVSTFRFPKTNLIGRNK